MKNRLPLWFRQELPDDSVRAMAQLISGFGLRTVCREARCPNMAHCFKNRKATFIILGDTCTRACGFCAVKKACGKSLSLDLGEPRRIADAVSRLKLDYAVITSVTRDDLVDGGAKIFAETAELIHRIGSGTKVELLIPDFQGDLSSLGIVVKSGPEVIAHNIETVKRLYASLRPQADYRLSMELLEKVKYLNPGLVTKSSLMLGLGESEEEVIEALKDLRRKRCDILTLGQYLAPSNGHYPVKEFIAIEQFQKYREIGRRLGFKSVFSGPLVRSSYHAQEVYQCMT